MIKMGESIRQIWVRVPYNMLCSVGKCKLPSAQGKCQNYTVRWFYNGSLCTRFWYGGCEGNENNFETEDQCQQECPGYVTEGRSSTQYSDVFQQDLHPNMTEKLLFVTLSNSNIELLRSLCGIVVKPLA